MIEDVVICREVQEYSIFSVSCDVVSNNDIVIGGPSMLPLHHDASTVVIYVVSSYGIVIRSVDRYALPLLCCYVVTSNGIIKRIKELDAIAVVYYVVSGDYAI